MGVALVTGGTSGIGAAFARALAARGDDVVLVARSADRLEEMALELRSMGGSVEIIQADLSDRDAVTRVAARLEDPRHPIDLLVNNAGFGVHTRLTDPDVDIHDRAFDVMCRAVLVLSGAAARAMTARGHGRIINVSSTAGYIAMGSYSAIKSWVTSFSEGLSVELRGSGVGVTALCPGWVRTEFHQRAGIRSSSIPGPLWLEAKPVVEACLRDADRGKVISIPTIRYRVLIWFARHLPRRAIRAISASISSSRRDAVAS